MAVVTVFVAPIETNESTPETVPQSKKIKTKIIQTNKTMTDVECGSIEGSVFSKYELTSAIAWLSYTALYWTLLTWIPILIRASFSVNLLGFVIWCFGCIGMMSNGYALYHHKYPSGATKENKFEINIIGRYTAAILTSMIIIDCLILVYFSVNFDNIEVDSVIQDTNFCRLIFHIIHIFWSSLFCINRFITFAKDIVITAFILQWINIIWNCIISFTVANAGESVDIIYFLIVGIQLIALIPPMFFTKKWGTTKYAENVSIYLLLFDLLTNIPVIITILATQSYKINEILTLDLIWKSFLIQRSVSLNSLYFVKQIFGCVDKTDESIDEAGKRDEIMQIFYWDTSFKFATNVWTVFVFIYWSVCVLCRCVDNGEIALNYEYYTWFVGVIGIFSVFFSNIIGSAANTKYGQSLLAYTCLCIAIDCICYLWYDKEDIIGDFMMICHCIALVTSLTFYSSAFKNAQKGVAYSIILQWLDIILMFIVMEILHSFYSNCFSQSVCNGYFAIFIIKIILIFVPIIFNYVNHEKRIHVHMVLLDTFTDLPLIFIVVATKGYQVHPFVFFDIIFKVIRLLISYSYHLIINIILAQCESISS